MKKIACLIIALILCLSSISTSFADGEALSFSDDPKAIQAASNSVVMLSCYDKDGRLYSTGSAFAAFDEGVFVTNYHVIEGEVYSIRAQMESGLEFRITSVVAYDEEKDIAILRTEAKTGLDPLPVGNSSELERGEKVIAIGSPLGLINTLSIGLYSGTIKEEGQRYLQFSAAISHGSSGGALFNNRGEVVVITSPSFTEGQNLNLPIPIDEAKTLYENADKTMNQSVAAFFENQKHAPSTSIYSPEYYKEHLKEYVGQEIEVEGYVVYLSDTRLFLSSTPNITDASSETTDMFAFLDIFSSNALCVNTDNLSTDGVKNGMKVSVRGTVKEKTIAFPQEGNSYTGTYFYATEIILC